MAGVVKPYTDLGKRPPNPIVCLQKEGEHIKRRRLHSNVQEEWQETQCFLPNGGWLMTFFALRLATATIFQSQPLFRIYFLSTH